MMKKPPYKVSEHDIQNSCISYLQTTGWLCWRNNSGLISIGEGIKRRMMKVGMAGLPDVFAIKDGLLLGVEVKSAKGKTTPSQDYMLNELRNHGAATVIAHSLDELISFIKIL